MGVVKFLEVVDVYHQNTQVKRDVPTESLFDLFG
jgi:hypothetical protein